jgi:hypothetical protein
MISRLRVLSKIEVGQSIPSPQTLCRPVSTPALPLFHLSSQGETSRHAVQLFAFRIKPMFLTITQILPKQRKDFLPFYALRF